MTELRIPELETSFVFRKRAEPIPGDLRPQYCVSLLLIMLHISSRGARSSFMRLQVLYWTLRAKRNAEALESLVRGNIDPDAVLVRIDPSLNRAVDFARGEGLIRIESGGRIELTQRGADEAENLVGETELLKKEKILLKGLGKRLTEGKVNELFKRKGN